MPSNGEKQIQAGYELDCNNKPRNKILGERSMISNNSTIKTTLRIDNIPYKGNAVLNANK